MDHRQTPSWICTQRQHVLQQTVLSGVSGVCVSVSQNVFPPPAEPSLPDAGPGPVLLLLSDRRPLHVPQQVSGATVQRVRRLQQPASRWVLYQRTNKKRRLWETDLECSLQSVSGVTVIQVLTCIKPFV